MRRINDPIKTGLAVSPSLAAIAPATPAATLRSRRARRDRRPRRYTSCISDRAMALAGATRGSEPWAGSGSRCRAAGGGLLAVRMRREHLDPVAR